MDFVWSHIRVGVKANFSNISDFDIWALHALFSPYALVDTQLYLLGMPAKKSLCY